MDSSRASDENNRWSRSGSASPPSKLGSPPYPVLNDAASVSSKLEWKARSTNSVGFAPASPRSVKFEANAVVAIDDGIGRQGGRSNLRAAILRSAAHAGHAAPKPPLPPSLVRPTPVALGKAPKNKLAGVLGGPARVSLDMKRNLFSRFFELDVAMFNPGGHWGRMTRQSAASVRSHAYSAKGSHISRALSGRGSGSAKSHVSWAAKSHISWAARSVRSYKSMGAKSRGGMSTKSRVYSVAGSPLFADAWGWSDARRGDGRGVAGLRELGPVAVVGTTLDPDCVQHHLLALREVLEAVQEATGKAGQAQPKSAGVGGRRGMRNRDTAAKAARKHPGVAGGIRMKLHASAAVRAAWAASMQASARALIPPAGATAGEMDADDAGSSLLSDQSDQQSSDGEMSESGESECHTWQKAHASRAAAAAGDAQRLWNAKLARRLEEKGWFAHVTTMIALQPLQKRACELLAACSVYTPGILDSCAADIASLLPLVLGAEGGDVLGELGHACTGSAATTGAIPLQGAKASRSRSYLSSTDFWHSLRNGAQGMTAPSPRVSISRDGAKQYMKYIPTPPGGTGAASPAKSPGQGTTAAGSAGADFYARPDVSPFSTAQVVGMAAQHNTGTTFAYGPGRGANAGAGTVMGGVNGRRQGAAGQDWKGLLAQASSKRSAGVRKAGLALASELSRSAAGRAAILGAPRLCLLLCAHLMAPEEELPLRLLAARTWFNVCCDTSACIHASGMDDVLPAVAEAAAAAAKPLVKSLGAAQEGGASPLANPTAALDVLHLLLGTLAQCSRVTEAAKALVKRYKILTWAVPLLVEAVQAPGAQARMLASSLLQLLDALGASTDTEVSSAVQAALCGDSDSEASPALTALVACITSGSPSDNSGNNKKGASSTSTSRPLLDSATAINLLWASVKGSDRLKVTLMAGETQLGAALIGRLSQLAHDWEEGTLSSPAAHLSLSASTEAGGGCTAPGQSSTGHEPGDGEHKALELDDTANRHQQYSQEEDKGQSQEEGSQDGQLQEPLHSSSSHQGAGQPGEPFSRRSLDKSGSESGDAHSSTSPSPASTPFSRQQPWMRKHGPTRLQRNSIDDVAPEFMRISNQSDQQEPSTSPAAAAAGGGGLKGLVTWDAQQLHSEKRDQGQPQAAGTAGMVPGQPVSKHILALVSPPAHDQARAVLQSGLLLLASLAAARIHTAPFAGVQGLLEAGVGTLLTEHLRSLLVPAFGEAAAAPTTTAHNTGARSHQQVIASLAHSAGVPLRAAALTLACNVARYDTGAVALLAGSDAHPGGQSFAHGILSTLSEALLGLVPTAKNQPGSGDSVSDLLAALGGAEANTDAQHQQQGGLGATADALQQAADIVVPAASTLINLLKHRSVLPEELSTRGREGLSHQLLQVACLGLQILIKPALSAAQRSMSDQHMQWQVAQLAQVEACSKAISVAGRVAEPVGDTKSTAGVCISGGAEVLAGMLTGLVPYLVSQSGIARVPDSTATKAAQGAVHSGAVALAVLLAKGHVPPAVLYYPVLPAVKAGLKGSDSAPKDLCCDMLRLLHLLVLNTKLASVAAKDSELVVTLKQVKRAVGGEVGGTAKQVLLLLDRHDRYGYIVPLSVRQEREQERQAKALEASQKHQGMQQEVPLAPASESSYASST